MATLTLGLENPSSLAMSIEWTSPFFFPDHEYFFKIIFCDWWIFKNIASLWITAAWGVNGKIPGAFDLPCFVQ